MIVVHLFELNPLLITMLSGIESNSIIIELIPLQPDFEIFNFYSVLFVSTNLYKIMVSKIQTCFFLQFTASSFFKTFTDINMSSGNTPSFFRKIILNSFKYENFSKRIPYYNISIFDAALFCF